MGEEAKEKVNWTHRITVGFLALYVVFSLFLCIDVADYVVTKDDISMIPLCGAFTSLALFFLGAFLIIRKYEHRKHKSS
jgi:surface polysaccharide O-acyltransferase-like enzyme